MNYPAAPPQPPGSSLSRKQRLLISLALIAVFAGLLWLYLIGLQPGRVLINLVGLALVTFLGVRTGAVAVEYWALRHRGAAWFNSALALLFLFLGLVFLARLFTVG